MNKKSIKSLVTTVCIGVILAVVIRQNVFASVVVKGSTNVNNKYKTGDKALVNLLNKTPKVGNYVMFNYKNQDTIGQITKVENNVITISKDNKQFTISTNDIKGTIFFKL